MSKGNPGMNIAGCVMLVGVAIVAAVSNILLIASRWLALPERSWLSLTRGF